MARATLNPTPNQTFELVGSGDCDFARILDESRRVGQSGDVERACNMRYAAFQRIAEAIPEDEEVVLEWEHRNSRAALELLHASAVDHFLIEDFEMSAAMLEMTLELDPEDHLEASELLAFNYLEIGEFELFDEVIDNVSEKSAARVILELWASHLREERVDSTLLRTLRTRFAPCFAEFTAAEHPADEAYLSDIESERPTTAALARELWFKTELLWHRHPDFIEALRRS